MTAHNLPDVQNSKDTRGKNIERVGVRRVALPLHVERKDINDGLPDTVNASVDAFVDISQELKGVNMSRFVQVLMEYATTSLNVDMIAQILTRMKESLQSADSYIRIKFPYFISRTSPVSGKKAPQQYYVTFIGRQTQEKTDTAIQVEAYVTNLCPCCFLPGTTIFTDKGVQDISAVENNQRTLENSVIEKQFKYPSEGKKYVEVKVVGTLPVRCSADHEIKVVTSQGMTWKKAANLKIEDLVVIPKPKIPFTDNYKILDLKPYKQNVRNFKKSKLVPDEIVVTPEIGRLLGLFLAEGGFQVKNKAGQYTSLNFSFHETETRLINFVVNTFARKFKTQAKVRPCKGQHSTTVGVHRGTITHAFYDMFKGKTTTVEIPQIVMESPASVIEQFILGWYEGDGSHNTKIKNQRINTTSYKAAMQLQWLFLKLGYFMSVIQEKAENSNTVIKKTGRKAMVHDIYSCNLSCDILYGLGWLKNPPQSRNPKIRQDIDYFYVPVTNISSIDYKGPVYDLQVSNTQYTVPFIVHNSKEVSEYGAHNQRAHLTVKIVPTQKLWWVEDIVNLIESQGSCAIFPLLKREDEKWVTERAYENPKFVEDLVRDVAIALDDRQIEQYYIRAEAEESIHTHNAIAFITKNWQLG